MSSTNDVIDVDTHLGERAVVLGASMSGLLAARVLADYFRTVTVVERDVLPNEPTNRRGVPQGRHPHALLARGAQTLGELFPGILDQLVADGAPVWDDGELSRLYISFSGHLMVRSGRAAVDHKANAMYHPSRPFLERHVRRRLPAIENVTIIDGRDVAELTSDGGSQASHRRLGDRPRRRRRAGVVRGSRHRRHGPRRAHTGLSGNPRVWATG
jgi:2-polyprenyl-6-methoxyphenol hydroxylase-like FAD-dependent oxidoreductase